MIKRHHFEDSTCTASRVFMLMSVATEQAHVMSSCKDSLAKYPTQTAVLTNLRWIHSASWTMALVLAFATSGVFTEVYGCYKTEYSQDENRFDE